MRTAWCKTADLERSPEVRANSSRTATSSSGRLTLSFILQCYRGTTEALIEATGQWAISWRDRQLKFHAYQRKRPTQNVQALLDHIENSGDPILWG